MAGLVKSPVVRRAAAAFVLSAAGLAGIKFNESGNAVHTVAYRDPVGIWTICDGHTATAKPGMRVTQDHCTWLLKQDTRDAQAAVQRLVKVPISQRQYDALVDFTFNKGQGNFAGSTLLRKLNAGDCHGAAAEFPRWNQAKGKVLPGLVVRAQWQRNLFEPDCP